MRYVLQDCSQESDSKWPLPATECTQNNLCNHRNAQSTQVSDEQRNKTNKVASLSGSSASDVCSAFIGAAAALRAGTPFFFQGAMRVVRDPVLCDALLSRRLDTEVLTECMIMHCVAKLTPSRGATDKPEQQVSQSCRGVSCKVCSDMFEQHQ